MSNTDQAGAGGDPLLDDIAKGDGWLGKWRAIQAWEITLETPIAVGCVFWRLMHDDGFILEALVKLTPLITVYMTARYAVLGVHIYRGSQERQLAITGSADVAKTARAD